MTLKQSPHENNSSWRNAGLAAFAVVVALFSFVSSIAGMSGLGVTMLVGAGVQIAACEVSYGWDGKESPGHIKGFPAFLVSLLMGATGIVMIIQPKLMLALFGWADA